MSSAVTMFNGPSPSPLAARAHAAKNCLSVILAISHLLERELTGAGRERCHRLKSAAALLGELLAGDLLAGASEALPEPRPCSVAALCEIVGARLADRAESAGVELVVHCEGGSIVGDERSLVEALFNLVANAIEATSRGGLVALATHVTDDGDHQWVLQDSGHGIPEDQIPELGTPHVSRKRGGSGLGLSLARDVIAAHRGLLHVESCVGTGTIITILMPKGPCAT